MQKAGPDLEAQHHRRNVEDVWGTEDCRCTAESQWNQKTPLLGNHSSDSVYISWMVWDLAFPDWGASTDKMLKLFFISGLSGILLPDFTHMCSGHETGLGGLWGCITVLHTCFGNLWQVWSAHLTDQRQKHYAANGSSRQIIFYTYIVYHTTCWL